jgi:hypothetical protein
MDKDRSLPAYLAALNWQYIIQNHQDQYFLQMGILRLGWHDNTVTLHGYSNLPSRFFALGQTFHQHHLRCRKMDTAQLNITGLNFSPSP